MFCIASNTTNFSIGNKMSKKSRNRKKKDQHIKMLKKQTSKLRKNEKITVFLQKIENYLHHQLAPQVVAELIASLPGELIQQSSAHKICSTDQ